ncbi:MAG TPA: two-component system response regulator DcuR [Bacillus bacterium]|uniref:Response regulator n=1 Tax=Bacillus norwichensis TaxID=2762217 RepID=A0ABR8VRG1_9BACI|nr:response regulator [Bacillus norwichensis]HBZ09413.1 two-component system response regulator DcuR [Bacillus sp. (in: firmicutes)]
MINVLIVEDDPMVAEINKKYLEAVSGFTCSGIASNVKEALKMLENNNIDLLLLDIYMPGELGVELLSQIRAKREEIDVIIITAANDIDIIQSALHLGVVDYLIKPFEFGRFSDSLIKYKKNKQLLNEQKEKLQQAEIDQLFKREGSTPGSADIPKGLTKATLEKITKRILKKNDHFFSTDELAGEVGISRVSMGKYLSFLSEIQFLEKRVEYGTKGRPANKYCLRKENMEVINQYIR